MKRALPWIIGVLVLVAAAAWFATRGSHKGEKFATEAVTRGDIEETVSALGKIQPRQYVDVGTQVTGQLKTLHVEVGDAVKAGALVAEIDPTVFEARVNETKATLQSLQAQLAERAAAKQLADQTHARNSELLRIDAVAKELVEASAAAADQAAAQVQSVRAQIQQTLSQLEANQANLRYTKIYAPMSGTVVSLTARQGQTLVSSQQAPTILRIADLSTMTVWAQVSEADVPKVSVGMPAYFSTLGEPGRRWTGKVQQVMPTPEAVNDVVLYNVLFDVANPDQALKTQMSAQVRFLLAAAKDTLLVPSAALRPAGKTAGAQGEVSAPRADKKGAKHHGDAPVGERRYVVRVLEGGKVDERPVTVGVMNRLSAQVLNGLKEGEQVVVGTLTAKDEERSGGLPRLGAVR